MSLTGYIPEKKARILENNKGIVHVNDTWKYTTINKLNYHIDDVVSLYNGDFALKENATYINSLEGYVLNTECVETPEGLELLEDTIEEKGPVLKITLDNKRK